MGSQQRVGAVLVDDAEDAVQFIELSEAEQGGMAFDAQFDAQLSAFRVAGRVDQGDGP
jgi:hypothetical protein